MTTTNSDGDLVSGIVGLCEGELMTFVASGSKISEAIDMLCKGDIVQVKLDAKGEIYDNPPYVSTKNQTIDLDTDGKYGAVKRRFSVENQDLKPLRTEKESSYYGEVCTVNYLDTKANRMLVVGKNDMITFINIATTTKYYIYDTEKAIPTPVTVADLGEGAFIFVKRSTNKASQIYIIK